MSNEQDQTGQQRRGRRRFVPKTMWGKIGAGAGLLVALIVILSIATNPPKPAPASHTAAPAVTHTAKAGRAVTRKPAAPATHKTTSKPSPSHTATPTVTASPSAPPSSSSPPPASSPSAPASPAMTIGQQQAVDSAQNYLSLGQGFSEQGLLNQLTSKYGEGDTQADAEFAISYLHPDWDQQAVESAKNYLSLGEGFSRASLYQQLTSSYGAGFTPAQADYALSKVGM